MPKYNHPRKLNIDNTFTPLIPKAGDEVYPNGLFYFNITEIRKYIEKHTLEIQLTQIEVNKWHTELSNKLKEEYIELADITRPVILAEIAPDRLKIYPDINLSDWYMRGFSLIDGHHRLEKAYRQGVKFLPAYILYMEQHIKFMYNGYKEYAEYWNLKLKLKSD